MAEIKLTAADKHSALWGKLSTHMGSRLEAYRNRIEGNLSPDETTKLRGRIAELKHLLAIGNETPAPSADSGE